MGIEPLTIALPQMLNESYILDGVVKNSLTRVVVGHLSPTKPRGPWLKADEHSHFSLASDRAQFYNTLPATTRFCLSLAPDRCGY